MTVMSPNHPSLFDVEDGRVRRNRGVRAVELAEWRDDRRQLDRIILMFADGGSDFTSDDVWPYIAPGIRPNAVGAAFLRAAKKGIISERGYRPSVRPEARSRRILIWRGSHA